MTAQRARYCTFVACLKPVMDEEMGCFGEVAQLEDVMAKLGKVSIKIVGIRSKGISLKSSAGDGEPREPAGHVRADHGGREGRRRLRRRRTLPLPRHTAVHADADLKYGTEVATTFRTENSAFSECLSIRRQFSTIE